MGPSNLGIVFGPSLMRPRPTGATISLSSLVDYPHQARIVEAFIVFYPSIFQCQSSQKNKSSRPSFTPSQQVASHFRVQIHKVSCVNCGDFVFIFGRGIIVLCIVICTLFQLEPKGTINWKKCFDYNYINY